MQGLGTTAKEQIQKSFDSLTDMEKMKISRRILISLLALVCLLAGLLHQYLFPGQDGVKGIILLIGAFIVGIPLMLKAVKGFIHIGNTVEQLVTVALAACILGGKYETAIIIPIILDMVHFLEERSIMGGKDTIEALKALQETKALLITDTGDVEVNARELSPGNIIRIKPGEIFPVDGVVVGGISCVDQKSLTGESIPKDIGKGDNIYAGTLNLNGMVTVKVERELEDASFHKILKYLEDAEKTTLPEISIIDQYIRYFLPFVILIAAVTAFITKDISRSIAILVVSCPCAQILVSSTAIIASLSVCSKHGIIIRNSVFMEKLDPIHTAIFDKTGTLTEGGLHINGYLLAKADTKEVLFFEAAKVAKGSLHPVSKAVLNAAGDYIDSQDINIQEYSGLGVRGYTEDQEILLGQRKWLTTLGFDLPEEPVNIGPVSWVIKNSEVLGCILFGDRPRKGAKDVINKLKETGINNIILLTGDGGTAANEIKMEMGLDTVCYNLMPDDKLNYVKKEKQNGNRVVVIGDGINDALALKEADVGIAMGAIGSETAIQSADIALMNNNLSCIPFAIELSKKTRKTIFQNLTIAFFSSFIMIFLAATGVISPVLGAILHNVGAFAVLINSSRLLKESLPQ